MKKGGEMKDEKQDGRKEGREEREGREDLPRAARKESVMVKISDTKIAAIPKTMKGRKEGMEGRALNSYFLLDLVFLLNLYVSLDLAYLH